MLKGVTLKWRITNYDSVKNCSLKKYLQSKNLSFGFNKSGLKLS